MTLEKLLASAVQSVLSIDDFMKYAVELHELEKNVNHCDFEASSRYCMEEMRQAGFSDVERIAHVCDGKTVTLDDVMPEAWDRTGRCFLKIIDSDLPEKSAMLADTDEKPLSASVWSGATPEDGSTGEVIDFADCMDNISAVQGKWVFFDGNPGGEMYFKCARAGALGFVCSNLAQGKYYPDDIRWMNGPGRVGWYHVKEDIKLPVFSITPRKALWLRERMKQQKVMLHGVMRTRVYDGEIYTVTARIPGEEDAELALFAHMYEPFLNDNASGFALAMMLGRIIKALSANGTIRLRKSLRLVVSMEHYGFGAFLEDRKRSRKIFAAQNLDACVGHTMYGTPQKLRMSALCNPFFGDLELERLLKLLFPEMRYVREPGNLSDDTFGSDPQLDIPTIWLFNCPDRFHHSTCPAFGGIDRQMSEDILILLGTYLAELLGDHRIDLARQAAKAACAEYAKEVDDIIFECKAGTLNAMQQDFRAWVARMMVEGRIRSLDRLEKGLADKQNVKDLIRKIAARLPRQELYELSPQRCRAANMIPLRLTCGLPFSLARIPYAERPDRSQNPLRGDVQLFALFDGKRSVYECVELLAAFYRIPPCKDADMAKLIKYLEYLEYYGYFRISHPLHTTQEEFRDALKELGVKSGMKLVVHSAMSSLGTFDGGAEAFCRILTEVVGHSGTIMMPSFNFSNLSATGGFFDWRNTPSLAGASSEAFRKFPGVVRSLAPSHPVAVWGKDQIRYVAHHHQNPTMGQDSPLGMLESDGGYALMISCFHALSFMHVVETTNHVPCLGNRTESYDAILPDGTPVKLRGWGWRNGTCRALRYDDQLAYLRKHGKVSEMRLGIAHLMLFKLSDYRAAYEACMKVPGRGCRNCPVRPREVIQNVPTDWSDRENKLIPAGDAFVGEVDFAKYVNC